MEKGYVVFSYELSPLFVYYSVSRVIFVDVGGLDFSECSFALRLVWKHFYVGARRVQVPSDKVCGSL